MLNFICKDQYDLSDLRLLVHLLRQKDGCPWDSVQTHQSIRNNFLEEALEVCEALDTGDTALLREELGDVLLHVLFHTSIEEDTGSFNLDELADAVCKKLIFRHPNLFGQTSRESWGELKQRERGFTSHTQNLQSVARALPATWRAEKLLRRSAEAGFRWDDAAGPLSKVAEEVAEVREALGDSDRAEDELGDLLFAVMSVAHSAGIDPERALHRAGDKYIRRFARVEAAAGELSRYTEEELVALWRSVGKAEG